MAFKKQLSRISMSSDRNRRSVRYSEDVNRKSGEEERDVSFSIDRREEKRRSKYDLPIQYYDDAIKRYDDFSFKSTSANRGLQQAVAALRAFDRYSAPWENEDTMTPSIRYLKSDVLQKVIQMKPSYPYLIKMGIKKLKSDTCKQLKILYHHSFCDSSKPWPIDGIPTSIFCWSYEDFLNRRQFRSDVWIDIILRDRPETCLHMYKYKTDTEELIKYMNKIFVAFEIDDPYFDCEKVLNTIQDIDWFLEVFQHLIRDFMELERSFQDECNKVLALTFQKRESKNKYKGILEETLMNMEFMDPIEMRYQLRYYDSKATQSELKCENIENEYLKKITDIKAATQREHYCSQCASNSIYVDIENFKTRFTLLTEKYDKEYEAIDNKIQFNRLAIDKIRDQKKFMEEQIERFHEEIEIMEAKTIAEKAEEERQVMERLEAELRKKQAKELKKAAKAAAKKKNKK